MFSSEIEASSINSNKFLASRIISNLRHTLKAVLSLFTADTTLTKVDSTSVTVDKTTI